MKRPPSFKILPAFTVLFFFGTASVKAEQLITVLNPGITEKLAPRIPLAPRLDTLENKTIYIVDMNYEGMIGTPVLEEMKAWFAKNIPSVKIVLKLKGGSYISDDPALWKEIAAAKANGVILGVAG